MCHQATCALECDPVAVGAGRRFIRERLAEWGLAGAEREDVEAVLLAASELLTNAARFCDGRIGLELTTHRHEIAVAVTDTHPASAVVRTAGPMDEGGRGLALVEALAAEWGQQREDGAKTVWARFEVEPGTALAIGCTI